MPISGSCLCGAVRYEADEPFQHFVYCHCSRCRKATGAAHAANALVPRTAFRWLAGEDKVGNYVLPGAARGFATAWCTSCGAPVPHVTRSGLRVIVPAGSLDATPAMKPEIHAHWASRAGWYEDDPALPKADGDAIGSIPSTPASA
jgi:hypothetical protein